jgi:hypothetical protein
VSWLSARLLLGISLLTGQSRSSRHRLTGWSISRNCRGPEGSQPGQGQDGISAHEVPRKYEYGGQQPDRSEAGVMRGYRGSAIERFEKLYIPEPNSGCWLWLGATSYHNPLTTVLLYGRFFIGDGSKPRIERAHRASWRLYRGPIPDKQLVCHSCDNTLCVNPDHLWLGSHKSNTQDMIAKGRRKGNKSGRPKLTADQVISIRADSRQQAIIAREYGVWRDVIWRIKTRRTWREI